MAELKPCPFCGNQKIMLTNCGLWACWCTKCLANGGYDIFKKDAIEKWNRRVGEVERDG